MTIKRVSSLLCEHSCRALKGEMESQGEGCKKRSLDSPPFDKLWISLRAQGKLRIQARKDNIHSPAAGDENKASARDGKPLQREPDDEGTRAEGGMLEHREGGGRRRSWELMFRLPKFSCRMEVVLRFPRQDLVSDIKGTGLRTGAQQQQQQIPPEEIKIKTRETVLGIMGLGFLFHRA